MKMEALSLTLWRILNIFVGSREQVFISQIQCKIDKNADKRNKIVSSGSKAEGLNLPGSDEDIMFINTDIRITLPEFEDESNSDLIMVTTNIKPGFTKLKVARGQNRVMDKLGPYATALTKINDHLYLSSLLYRDRQVELLQRNQPGVQPHGPCGTFKDGIYEYDILQCLSSAMWPNVANEWIHRQRILNWPARDLVADVVSDGCLFVPVGNPLSDENHMEWRISFSLAEKKLVHSMNHTQILCYGLLKLFLKHVIDSRDNCKGLMCSYFLKTALFYCIEEENIEWEKHNLFPCFMACLRRLLFWVRQGYCPNYFVRTNNMFEHKIVGEKQRQLEEYLFSLYENGVDSMMKIPILFIIRSYILSQGSVCEIPRQEYIENECKCDYEVFETYLLSSHSNIEDVVTIMDTIKRELLQSNIGQVHRMLLMIHNFIYASQLVQYRYQLISSSHIPNKARYTQLRSLSNYIVDKCTKGDICTGWIQYATLCYLTGKNNKVISTVEYILTKFKSFVYYRGPIIFMVDKAEYIKHMCGKGFTIRQKLTSAFAQMYRIFIDCEFYPEEIKTEIEQYRHKEFNPVTFIHPKVYCYILLFLVYNKTRQMELRDKTLDRLCTVVEKREFITEYEIPLASALVQKCLDLATS